MYTLTDESTGEVLQVHRAGDYPANTDAIALKQAAANAKKLARAGRTVRLTGPELTLRRYAPEYMLRSSLHPYRLPCACGGWRHPVTRGHGELCRECYRLCGIPEEQRERAGTLAEKRWSKA